MKSFPAHYHLVEFIYSPLNFNSREQAYSKQGNHRNHRFISIKSIIDYFTRCKCKFEIREKERERRKIFDFINVSPKRHGEGHDQRIQPTRGTLLLTNKKILFPWQPTTVIAVTGSAVRGWCTSPRDNNSRPTCDVGHGTPVSLIQLTAPCLLISTFIRGWRLHKAILPISLGI